MKTALSALALILALAAPAHAQYVTCNPDPFAGAWPEVTVPAVPGYSAAYTVEINPAQPDSVQSGNLAWPRAWGEAMHRANLALQVVIKLQTLHQQGKIDYQQVLDGAHLVVEPWRDGVRSGSTAVYQGVTYPLYTELRWHQQSMPSGLTLRQQGLWINVWDLDRLDRFSWADETTSQHLNTPHSRTYYTGTGLAPEVSEALWQILKPAPAAGFCAVP